MASSDAASLKENSNWGRWGDDDERGALNLITPEAVLAGLQVPTIGKVYHLGLPVQRDGSAPILFYRNKPQRLTSTNPGDRGMFAAFGADPDVGSNEDVVIMDSHCLSHMDALSHVFAKGSLYNGFSTDTITTTGGTTRCGIDKVGGIAGRAVVLDLPGYFGVDWLEPGQVITSEDLSGAAAARNVDVRSGDILLVRTGYLDYWRSLGSPSNPTEQPGLGFDAVSFIKDHDVAVVGMDNSAIEPYPFDKNVFLGVHIELLVKLGVHLLEHLNLNELAADEVAECFLTIAPVLVPGASGSPINPIAIA